MRTENGTRLIRALFGKTVFDHPKPIALIERICQMVGDEGIFLDFFSGSASCAHGIIEQNLKDKGQRRYIMVQLPEEIAKDSIPAKEGYKKITEIAIDRLKLLGKQIKENKPKELNNLDLGFKVYKLDTSNIKAWDGNPENLEKSLWDTQNNIKEDRTEEDVLYEILLKFGLDLTLPIEERTIGDLKVFNVGYGALFVCLGDDITSKIAEGIGQWKEEVKPEVCRVIFKDSGFNDVEKTNAAQTLKRFGIHEIKSI
jgi:adenine-specific DNA-methyltransferase